MKIDLTGGVSMRGYKLWDKDFNLIGSWDGPPPAEALIDGRNMTIDYSSGERWSGRIENGEPVQDIEFVTQIFTEDPEKTA